MSMPDELEMLIRDAVIQASLERYDYRGQFEALAKAAYVLGDKAVRVQWRPYLRHLVGCHANDHMEDCGHGLFVTRSAQNKPLDCTCGLAALAQSAAKEST